MACAMFRLPLSIPPPEPRGAKGALPSPLSTLGPGAYSRISKGGGCRLKAPKKFFLHPPLFLSLPYRTNFAYSRGCESKGGDIAPKVPPEYATACGPFVYMHCLHRGGLKKNLGGGVKSLHDRLKHRKCLNIWLDGNSA